MPRSALDKWRFLSSSSPHVPVIVILVMPNASRTHVLIFFTDFGGERLGLSLGALACYCIPDANEFIGGKNKYR